MLPLLLACRPGAPTLLSVAVAADQPLSLDVAWAAFGAEGLWLERILEDGTILRDAVSPDGGSARAHGHPALSVVTVRLVTDAGEVSEATELETGNLSPGTPTFTVEGDLLADDELLLISTSVLDPDDLFDVTVALRGDGQVVWLHAEEAVDVFRPDLLLTEDGWWSNRLAPPTGDAAENALVRRDWSGGIVETIPTPGGHHVFAQTSGGMAWPIEEARTIEGEVWIGDALLLDGEPLLSVWDDLDAEALIGATPESMRPRLSHANGLHYAPSTDRLLVTLGAQAAVLEVDAGTGAPLRWLGSAPPDGLGLPAATWAAAEAMALPHMAAWTDDGTLLLTGSSPDFAETWATEFAVEGADLVPVWSHGRGESLGTPALGHAERLPGGDTLVSYGTRGVIQRVSPDGAVRGAVTVELGRIFGRAAVSGPLPLTGAP